MNNLDDIKRKIRSGKIATGALCVIFILSVVIGVVLLVFYAPKWNDSERWAAIVGIVFVLIALVVLLAFVVMIIIVCKLYQALTGGKPYRPPADLSNVKYPRQAAYENTNYSENETGGAHPGAT